MTRSKFALRVGSLAASYERSNAAMIGGGLGRGRRAGTCRGRLKSLLDICLIYFLRCARTGLV